MIYVFETFTARIQIIVVFTFLLLLAKAVNYFFNTPHILICSNVPKKFSSVCYLVTKLIFIHGCCGVSHLYITCRNGVFVHSQINNNSKDRTAVDGKTVYGHNIALSNMTLAGDILHEDYERTMSVNMSCMDYTGALKNVYLTMDHASKWTATGDSTVVLMGDIHPEQIDGNGMITIHAHAGEGCELSGTYALESGGKLIFDL